MIAPIRSVSIRLRVLKMRMSRLACLFSGVRQHTRQAQQVGENTGCGHVRPGTGSANDQWILAVAPRHELHDIVRQTDIGERMAALELVQADAGCTSCNVDLRNIAQDAIPALRRSNACRR